MTTNTDFVGVNNPSVLMYAYENDLIPEYFLESDEITPESVSRLHKVAFADPEHRQFPCHNKAATLYSAIWYAGNGMQDEKLKSNIEKMASIHNITDDVKKAFNTFEAVIEKAAAAKKAEAPMTKYAYTVDFEGYKGRGVENYYPINTQVEIIKSADDASSDYRKGYLPLLEFRKVAHTIMQAADEIDVPYAFLDPTVLAVGATRLPDPDVAASHLGMRKNAGAEINPYEELLEKLAEGIEKYASSPEEAVELGEKAAEAMYDLDVKNGIESYNHNLQDPFSILFVGPQVSEFMKAAASLIPILGVQVPVADFLNLSDNKIDKVFSKKAGSVIKGAKSCVDGEESIEKCAAASNKLKDLDPETSKMLLKVLADLAW